MAWHLSKLFVALALVAFTIGALSATTAVADDGDGVAFFSCADDCGCNKPICEHGCNLYSNEIGGAGPLYCLTCNCVNGQFGCSCEF